MKEEMKIEGNRERDERKNVDIIYLDFLLQ